MAPKKLDSIVSSLSTKDFKEASNEKEAQGVHLAMITKYKKELVENAPEVFGKGAKTKKDIQAQIEELYR